MFFDVKERKGETETSMWERNIDQLTPVLPRPGIEPATRYMFDQELNLLQFGVWDDTQPTAPPGNTYIYWYRTTSMTYYWRERKLQNT